jgi:hypothetical protein
MRIALTKIHYSRTLSDETPAFTAVVTIDGNEVASVKNSGHGGADEFGPPPSLMKRKSETTDAFLARYHDACDAFRPLLANLIDAAKAFLRTEGSEHWEFEPLGQIVDRLLDETLTAKDMRVKAARAWKAGRILYSERPDQVGREYYSQRIPAGMSEAAARAKIRERYPQASFLADTDPSPSIDLPDAVEAKEVVA